MAALADIERPRDIPGIKRLINRRKRQVRTLERLLNNSMPADIRKITTQRLAGTRANLASWETYLKQGRAA